MSALPMPGSQDGDADLYELRNVWKSFGATPVLRGVDLRLCRGETLGIIGPSGAGKSVLLKCMVALQPIDRGQLLFEGRSVPSMSLDEQRRLRQRVGFLFQAGVLFDSMTARENLEYALHEQFFHTMTNEAMQERVAWAFKAVGLPLSELETMPKDLSGGMRKRVGIARAIVTRPEILLYDSPTEGLDPPNAHRISDLIVELGRELGVTSVVVSHDLRTVFTVCNRVGYLHDGQILETAPPASLVHSVHPEVRDFVTGHPPEDPFDPRESRPPETWEQTAPAPPPLEEREEEQCRSIHGGAECEHRQGEARERMPRVPSS
jgi:phospholipid/cholesterol/gamma-HCH transport system ATP-binding protein